MILGADWYMVLLGGTCQVGIMTFAKRRISLWLRAQFVVEICEVRLMSRQRKKHSEIVWEEKHRKAIRKRLSCRDHFVEIMKLAQGAVGLPPYQGTKYRGRWK